MLDKNEVLLLQVVDDLICDAFLSPEVSNISFCNVRSCCFSVLLDTKSCRLLQQLCLLLRPLHPNMASLPELCLQAQIIHSVISAMWMLCQLARLCRMH